MIFLALSKYSASVKKIYWVILPKILLVKSIIFIVQLDKMRMPLLDDKIGFDINMVVQENLTLTI